ncbi:MAG: c-type cytochrome [Myxococcaceae bacterium]|nr:c-type cytochrome [Myxococcaceae bacterium]
MVPALVAVVLAGAPNATEALVRLECHRCHEVENVAPPPMAKQCAGCHVDLSSAASDPQRMKQGHAEYGEAFDRFVRRTATLYVDVPPLVGLARFRASWLRRWLKAPDDLRPHLAESMPRLRLSDADVEVLVSGLGLSADAPLPTPPAERLAQGAALFDAKGCATCHLFGNARFRSQPAALRTFKRPAVSVYARAPDLRHARQRLNREVVVQLLLDPRAVNARAAMPSLGLTADEAALLADYVLAAPLAAPVKAPSTPSLKAPAKRRSPVRYEDVDARVFRKVCWHCHSNADFADGDGGPGNTGGFGFKGVGLSLASYEEVMNGSIGPDGEYRSIFRKGESGEPVLLEVLKRRVHENQRDFVKPLEDGRSSTLDASADAPLGMPLGLPALEPEELALVEAWIAAGKPRPASPPGAMPRPTMGR